MGPLGEHVGRVQSLKSMENPHWLLDYLFTGFSMAFLCALNTLIISCYALGEPRIGLNKLARALSLVSGW